MKSGHADLPLHYGKVPVWLAQRMSALGGAIVESIVMEYGRNALLQKLSDPFWFQSLGCVLGMDWHSSGITTSVMGALKKSVNQRSSELGIYICGGRGKHSRATPAELMAIANKTGLDGDSLVHSSRLSAKVDNTAIQDGFQLYLHSFVLSKEGEWAVIQQGMNTNERLARRYHWHSPSIKSFIEEPHTSIYGKNQGTILNLTDKAAAPTRSGILELTKENPGQIMREITKLVMPDHHDVRAEDVNLKRLGAVLALAHDSPVNDMESLLLLEGVGPRTIQSLTLVSEIIHGTPSRFSDPARFSFAHGGKDGHPFPVPITVYDESILTLDRAIQKAKMGEKDKSDALRNLSKVSQNLEKDFQPNNRFNDIIQQERDNSWKYEGRTVMGKAKKPGGASGQLELF
ncbi:DUF763 domain-containing protein [Dyadobacter sp. CY323]|uniref:DUF763 domain-containing protein n=1 Tax=Dyadobacter sp. CY323 TaxID=2907302 RepID=UPI001F24D39D|nr:DUF763 domain-containing protein [Dyadobacter sp. CY323]MCE6990932.1 DUF763 domain-containing protein [Dyadobacter sp. CY323]